MGKIDETLKENPAMAQFVAEVAKQVFWMVLPALIGAVKAAQDNKITAERIEDLKLLKNPLEYFSCLGGCPGDIDCDGSADADDKCPQNPDCK